jgi:hypothetical protein
MKPSFVVSAGFFGRLVGWRVLLGQIHQVAIRRMPAMPGRRWSAASAAGTRMELSASGERGVNKHGLGHIAGNRCYISA